MNEMKAKPFLKWAGGKTQLLEQLREYYPPNIKNYYEPFLGGGAVFFDVISRDNGIENCYLSDLNVDLITTYYVVQKYIDALIASLETIQNCYLRLSDIDRKAYFYWVRSEFNNTKVDMIVRSAQFIFLNRTCCNGLYRVNKKGKFNVPFGDCKKPEILDEKNLYNVSRVLKGITLKVMDFGNLINDQNIRKDNTFIYFDPPYRPVSKTASFTAYSGNFNDSDQIRLALLFSTLNYRGTRLMLSNSDTGDGFYERHYNLFNIRKVTANGSGRGKINDVLITNY